MGPNVENLQTVMGQRLKEARQRKNLSQAELGAIIGRDPSTISNYENGVRSIGNGDLINLAEVLKIPVAFLFGEEFATRDAELSMYEWLRVNRGDILENYREVFQEESPVPDLNQLAALISEPLTELVHKQDMRRASKRSTEEKLKELTLQEAEIVRDMYLFILKTVDESIEKKMAEFMSTVEEESHSHPSD